jgi:hypothetical protein
MLQPREGEAGKARECPYLNFFPHSMQDVTSEEQEAACTMTPPQDESQSKPLPQSYQALLVGLISALIFRHP